MNYTSISDVLKAAYGQKIYRLSLQSGCTCPNRDGKIATGGCTFCSAGGSGDFAAGIPEGFPVDVGQNGGVPYGNFQTSDTQASGMGSCFDYSDMINRIPRIVSREIEEARRLVDRKIPQNIPPENRRYIAYYQSYTNTYGDTDYLRALYRETIRRPEICILSIATRPDCLEQDKIDLLRELNAIKPVWVELGLQTASDSVARHIRRGYPTAVYDDAYRRLKAAGLTVITHVILGLPGEAKEDMLATVSHVAELYRSAPVPESGIYHDGIKLQLLHVLEGTALADEYVTHPFHIMTLDEYCDIVVSCLKLLPPETVIHRLTGDGPKRLLIEPQWSADKKRVLHALNETIRNA